MTEHNIDGERGLWISRDQFLRLWQAAVNLESGLPEDMDDIVWFTRGQPIRTLVVDLARIGEAQ